MNTKPSAALWRDLLAAARLFRARVLERGDAPPDLPGPTMAHYHAACRHWGQGQAILAHLCPKPPSPRLTALLAVALAGLIQQRWAAPIWVHQAVEAARRLGGESPARFVNAVLQKAASPPVAAMGATASAQALGGDAKQAFPTWLQAALAEATEVQWVALRDTLFDESRMVLRWTGSDARRAAAIARWEAAGHQVRGDDALWLHPPADPARLEGYANGEFRLQNPSAQRMLEHLALRPGMRVLDACAAPGGKGFLLAEQPGLDIVSIDQSQPRLDRMARELERLRPGLKSVPRLVCADLCQGPLPVNSVDLVVLDVPCTGLGTLGRHPEVIWRRSPEDVARLSRLQRGLLASAWAMLRPGGQLLYMNCSILAHEGEQVLQAWLAQSATEGPKAERLPAAGQIWPSASMAGQNATVTLPADGFYFASLRKLA